MQAWRIIPKALLAVAGVVLVLTVLAKVRERSDDSRTVATTGAVTFTVLALAAMLTLTVLPALATWILVAVVASAVVVMVLAS